METKQHKLNLSGAVLLVKLSTKGAGWSRTNPAISAETAAAHSADASAGRWVDQLIPREVTRKLDQLRTTARAHVKTHSLKWQLDSGAGLVPVAKYQAMADYIAEIDAAIQAQVRTELVNRWGQILESARAARGDLYRATDYPEPHELPAMYGVRLRAMPLPDISALQRVCGQKHEALRAQLAAEMREQEREAAAGMYADLFSRLADPLRAIAAKCRALNAGNQKRVHSSITENVTAACEIVAGLDFIGSDELKEAIRITKVFGKLDAADFKGDGGSSERWRKAVGGRATAAADMVGKLAARANVAPAAPPMPAAEVLAAGDTAAPTMPGNGAPTAPALQPATAPAAPAAPTIAAAGLRLW